MVHIFNVHLGTAFFERRKQALRLFGKEILESEDLTGARIVLGDFNEWSHGLASRLFSARFHSADPVVTWAEPAPIRVCCPFCIWTTSILIRR